MNLARLILHWVAAIALAATIFAPGTASADVVNYSLTSPNDALSPYPGPYGSLEVNLTDSTHATLTLTNATNGVYTYSFIDTNELALNTNGAVTVGTPVGTPLNANFGTPTYTTDTSAGQQVDGFGKFNVSIDASDGYSDAVKKLVVTLTNTSGSWASASDVLTANNQGALFAAHVAVTDATTPSPSIAALATGFASNGGAVSVPEPTPIVMALVGLGTLGLASLRRRRRLPVVA